MKEGARVDQVVWGGRKNIKVGWLALTVDLTSGCVLNKRNTVDVSTCFCFKKQQSV